MQLPNIHSFEALVSSIGTREIGPVLSKFYSCYLSFDEITVYFFPLNDPPRCILAQAPDDRSAIIKAATEQYVKSSYLDDDNLLDLQNKIKGRSSVVAQVHRDDVVNCEFKSWFHDTGIESKLLVLARIGSGYMNTNLYRYPSTPFDDQDVEVFNKLSKFAFSCLRLHVVNDESSEDTEARDKRLQQIEQMLMVNRTARLTEREAEVCARIVMGYSTLAIALNLDISKHTVATIRKRAYARLSISSQNELFELVLRNLMTV